MKQRTYNILLTVLFCLFIGGMFLGSLILPDREFSQLENRNLEQAPKVSLENITTGEFMEDAEDYVNDQIIGRDFWVALKAWSERVSGKQENNGVYFAKEDTLISRVDTPSWEDIPAQGNTPAQQGLHTRVEYVNALVNNVDVPVYFGIIPSAAEIWSDRLYNAVQTHTIDLYSALAQHKDEDLYYRTDHHWTSLGAYYGYTALMDAMGLEAVPLDESQKVTVSEDFYGTLFSSSGVRWLPPDHIDRYISDEGVTVTAYPNGTPEPGSLYVDSYLEVKDKYSSFLGGNKPLCVIETEHTDAPKVLVIRDSYADSLAPFLTQNFSEIHLFDPRYNLTSVKDYVAQNEIDSVVVLYSISNFTARDNQMFVLGR